MFSWGLLCVLGLNLDPGAYFGFSGSGVQGLGTLMDQSICLRTPKR